MCTGALIVPTDSGPWYIATVQTTFLTIIFPNNASFDNKLMINRMMPLRYILAQT